LDSSVLSLWALMTLGMTLLITSTLCWTLGRSTLAVVAVGMVYVILTRVLLPEAQARDELLVIVALTIGAVGFVVFENIKRGSKTH